MQSKFLVLPFRFLQTTSNTPSLSVTLTDTSTGEHSLPTDGFMVWPVPHAIHRRDDLFPRPTEFIPERFLSDDSLPPGFPPITSASWRPFERGPRNCIGQELAMIETKVIMALAFRLIEFEAAYPPVTDKEKGHPETYSYEGHRPYQVLLGTAKPKSGMPCTIKLRG